MGGLGFSRVGNGAAREDKFAPRRASIADSPDELLNRVRGVVFRTCPRALGSQREDLVQAVILRVLEVQKEQGTIRTTSYLLRVVHSVLIDEFRRNQRRREAQMDDPATEAVETRAATQVTEADELRDLGDGIRDCLKQIGGDRQSAVLLHLHGFSAEEGSRSWGFDLKKVQNLTYRGLAELRQCLKAKGFR